MLAVRCGTPCRNQVSHAWASSRGSLPSHRYADRPSVGAAPRESIDTMVTAAVPSACESADPSGSGAFTTTRAWRRADAIATGLSASASTTRARAASTAEEFNRTELPGSSTMHPARTRSRSSGSVSGRRAISDQDLVPSMPLSARTMPISSDVEPCTRAPGRLPMRTVPSVRQRTSVPGRRVGCAGRVLTVPSD